MGGSFGCLREPAGSGSGLAESGRRRGRAIAGSASGPTPPTARRSRATNVARPRSKRAERAERAPPGRSPCPQRTGAVEATRSPPPPLPWRPQRQRKRHSAAADGPSPRERTLGFTPHPHAPGARGRIARCRRAPRPPRGPGGGRKGPSAGPPGFVDRSRSTGMRTSPAPRRRPRGHPSASRAAHRRRPATHALAGGLNEGAGAPPGTEGAGERRSIRTQRVPLGTRRSRKPRARRRPRRTPSRSATRPSRARTHATGSPRARRRACARPCAAIGAKPAATHPRVRPPPRARTYRRTPGLPRTQSPADRVLEACPMRRGGWQPGSRAWAATRAPGHLSSPERRCHTRHRRRLTRPRFATPAAARSAPDPSYRMPSQQVHRENRASRGRSPSAASRTDAFAAANEGRREMGGRFAGPRHDPATRPTGTHAVPVEENRPHLAANQPARCSGALR